MIVKKRTIPIKILKNNALLRRLPNNSSKIPEIMSDLAKRMAGYRGEQALDFHLSKLPEKDYHIFHGLRLTNGIYFFQIDTLILTTRYALILEIKNYAGVLYFDPVCNQLIQTNPAGEEKGYANPIEQANQQLQELKKWVNKRNIPLPIEFLVVISKPSTIIKTTPNYTRILQRVKHVQYLNSEIEKINQSYKELIDTKEIKRISHQLNKEHQPETFDVLNYYKIPFNEVKTGVICPSCHSLSMKRQYATWYCQTCKIANRDAHYQAVIDLFLLNNDQPVSNHEIRQFLGLASRTTSLKILLSLNLPHTGTGKGRRYLPPPRYQDIPHIDIQLY
ncbi:NERD domain-containing protein [Bacillus sp. ISL-47]|uniref:nuclease-related domain-containing protein n=1 Tax=Bacillus sp. ISL-47 TaxID=2819130 RepID=UPI001BEC77C4|nr:nuclease-related domain-containing protein [Bacillus sp. ISL-47]MBT2689066.1 NERD domain-containing protein [Bacillus sp. ISL-47]MBT2708522.1 NERD domain-containing protein [Pseudomonas sp. ISL-84]